MDNKELRAINSYYKTDEELEEYRRATRLATDYAYWLSERSKSSRPVNK